MWVSKTTLSGGGILVLCSWMYLEPLFDIFTRLLHLLSSTVTCHCTLVSNKIASSGYAINF